LSLTFRVFFSSIGTKLCHPFVGVTFEPYKTSVVKSLSNSVITILIIRFIIHDLRILSLQYDLRTILKTNNGISLNSITRVVLVMETCVCLEVESESMRALVMTVVTHPKEEEKLVKRIHTVFKQKNQMRMQGQPLGFLYLDTGRLFNQDPSGRSCDRLTPSRFFVVYPLS
jgi:hypothetical protein